MKTIFLIILIFFFIILVIGSAIACMPTKVLGDLESSFLSKKKTNKTDYLEEQKGENGSNQ